MTLIEILKKAGFKGNGLAMAYAIAMAESGGNAKAYNGTGLDNSYGLFQINMYGSMGPARRKQYGLSSNNALYDALTNAKVAYAISNGGKNWGPWSTYTNGAYKSYYGGSMGATVSYNGSSSSTSSGTKASTANLSMSDMAARFGLSAEVLRQNKQIRDLVKKGVSEGWDQTLFQAYLKNTKWWRTTSDAERKFFYLKASDPATYKQKYSAYQFSINQLAVKAGLASQIVGGKASDLLNKAILYKMREGWSDARISAYLGQSVSMHDGVFYGDAGEAYDQLFQLAYNNGLSFSKSKWTTEVRNVVSGKATLEQYEGQIRQQAAAKYSAFADQIKAGQNALDLAQPYIQSVSNILELPATDIDLSNKYVSQAMTKKQTGPLSGTQYPMWQFENDLRNDPLWKQTNNARESMMGTAHQVLKDFGLAF